MGTRRGAPGRPTAPKHANSALLLGPVKPRKPAVMEGAVAGKWPKDDTCPVYVAGRRRETPSIDE